MRMISTCFLSPDLIVDQPIQTDAADKPRRKKKKRHYQEKTQTFHGKQGINYNFF